MFESGLPQEPENWDNYYGQGAEEEKALFAQRRVDDASSEIDQLTFPRTGAGADPGEQTLGKRTLAGLKAF